MTVAADWILRVARPDVLVNAWSHDEGVCSDFDRPFIDAWKASGITCIFQNAGEEGSDPLRLVKRLARFTYVTDRMREFVTKAVEPDDVVAAKKAGRFDYDAFDRLTEHALNNELETFDPREVLAGFETLMTELGVMPFDEEELPREDPKTF